MLREEIGQQKTCTRVFKLQLVLLQNHGHELKGILKFFKGIKT